MAVPIIVIVAWLALAVAAAALGLAIDAQIKVKRCKFLNWSNMARGVMQTAEQAWANIPPQHQDRIKAKVVNLAENGLNKFETASPW